MYRHVHALKLTHIHCNVLHSKQIKINTIKGSLKKKLPYNFMPLWCYLQSASSVSKTGTSKFHNGVYLSHMTNAVISTISWVSYLVQTRPLSPHLSGFNTAYELYSLQLSTDNLEHHISFLISWCFDNKIGYLNPCSLVCIDMTWCKTRVGYWWCSWESFPTDRLILYLNLYVTQRYFSLFTLYQCVENAFNFWHCFT